MYRMSGRTAATTATAGNALFGLWNPHASVRPRIVEIGICTNAAPAAGASLWLSRTTARGTATSTVTPDIDNDIQRAQTPTSGLLLDVTYSVQPTFDASPLWQWTFAAVAASGIVIPLAFSIPPGAGVAFRNVPATIFPISDVNVAWNEET
jgi:hypothetical protein